VGFVVGGPMTETALVAPILVALAVAATGAAIVCDTEWRVRVKLPEEIAEESWFVIKASDPAVEEDEY